MDFNLLAPDGPAILTPKIWRDSRGYFMETFRQNEFEAHCGKYEFVQDNQSQSSMGVLRGLHYQLNHPQGKLVRVIGGKVFDVAVDLRQSSPTFGKSFSVTLDTEASQCFWIPPGFAHGFFVLSPMAEFVYKCTDYYAPGDEYCLFWNDPALDINWPAGTTKPVLSDKDQMGKSFADCAKYL